MRSSRLAFWQWAILFPFVVAQNEATNTTQSLTSVNVNATGSTVVSSTAKGTSTALVSTTFETSSAIRTTTAPVSILSPTATVNASSVSTLSSAVSSPPAAPSPLFTTGIATTGFIPSTTALTSSIFSPFPVPSDVPEPPTYPSVDPSNPPLVGAAVVADFGPAWAAAHAKAKKKKRRGLTEALANFNDADVAGFTLEQKVSVATGVGWEAGRCVGNIGAIEGNGTSWPGLCLEDSPLGVRDADFVTGFPAGINAAASWNRALMRQRGLFMGQEHRGKGVNVQLGPMMNMGRIAQGGRNWEGFGADPFLTGESAYETILGIQEGGVIACAKHLIGNEQEHDRTTSSSDMDDRTMHEVYAHPFLKSVMAGVGSMMCSYNQLNSTFACENDRVMNEIIKGEFGFQGFIMSDWQAQHSTLAANTGLDMSMPGDITFNSGTSYYGANLTAAVHEGIVAEARVEDMASRILAAWYLMRQDAESFPDVNFDAFNPDSDQTNMHIDVQDDHYKLVRTLGAASTVLLKNERGVLPLGKKDRSIVLIGSGAGPGRAGPNQFSDQGGSDGVLAMGWGSGTANFTYLVTPLDAIQRQARKFRTSVSWMLDDFNLPKAGNMARKRNAAIVFLEADSGEDYITVDGNEGDRKNLTAWHGGDALVLSVAAQNNNTIVVVNSVGPLILEPWIDHPNVTAVLWAGLPGQEAGNSLADVLYGAWNPSGHLPYTIAKSPSDYGAQLVLPAPGQNPSDTNPLHVPYTEGLNIDYRHFDANNITPRFEFGFGLSYTTFSYSGLHLSKISTLEPPAEAPLVQAWERGNATAIAEGSSRALWLHRPAYKATFTVKNSGSVFGGEIPQLYINFPASSGEPPSVLKGFTNVDLSPGQSSTVTITLSRYDLSIWDVQRQGWTKPDGKIGVTIGASSRASKLTGSLAI